MTLIRLTQATPQNEACPEVYLPCEGIAEISSIIDQHDDVSTLVAYIDGRKHLVLESPDEVAALQATEQAASTTTNIPPAPIDPATLKMLHEFLESRNADQSCEWLAAGIHDDLKKLGLEPTWATDPLLVFSWHRDPYRVYARFTPEGIEMGRFRGDRRNEPVGLTTIGIGSSTSDEIAAFVRGAS